MVSRSSLPYYVIVGLLCLLLIGTVYNASQFPEIAVTTEVVECPDYSAEFAALHEEIGNIDTEVDLSGLEQAISDSEESINQNIDRLYALSYEELIAEFPTIDELDKAIEFTEGAKASHEYILWNPELYDLDDVGDLEFQWWCIQNYDQVLEVLYQARNAIER